MASIDPWHVQWKDLTLTKLIGEGAFSKVWLGRWGEHDVAIKQMGPPSALGAQTSIKLDKELQKALHKEVGLMKTMRHPNIILFMGVVLEPPAMLMEYCAQGSLYDLLKAARSSPVRSKALDWPRRIMMALDAAKGMLYLHGHKPTIIHCDLRSPNLLVQKNWRVKVTEFKLARTIDSDGTTALQSSLDSSLDANNPRWQPPEVIKAQQYGKESDVYAFGLILWELLTWQLPFSELSNFQIMLAEQSMRPIVPDHNEAAQLPGGTFLGYDEYVALMQRCWAEKPEDRPTFEKIIEDLRTVAKIQKESQP